MAAEDHKHVDFLCAQMVSADRHAGPDVLPSDLDEVDSCAALHVDPASQVDTHSDNFAYKETVLSAMIADPSFAAARLLLAERLQCLEEQPRASHAVDASCQVEPSELNPEQDPVLAPMCMDSIADREASQTRCHDLSIDAMEAVYGSATEALYGPVRSCTSLEVLSQASEQTARQVSQDSYPPAISRQPGDVHHTISDPFSKWQMDETKFACVPADVYGDTFYAAMSSEPNFMAMQSALANHLHSLEEQLHASQSEAAYYRAAAHHHAAEVQAYAQAEEAAKFKAEEEAKTKSDAETKVAEDARVKAEEKAKAKHEENQALKEEVKQLRQQVESMILSQKSEK